MMQETSEQRPRDSRRVFVSWFAEAYTARWRRDDTVWCDGSLEPELGTD